MHLYVYVGLLAVLSGLIVWGRLVLRRMAARDRSRFRMIIGMPVPRSGGERSFMNEWVDAVLDQHLGELLKTVRAQMQAEQRGDVEAVATLRTRRAEQENLYTLACHAAGSQGFPVARIHPIAAFLR